MCQCETNANILCWLSLYFPLKCTAQRSSPRQLCPNLGSNRNAMGEEKKVGCLKTGMEMDDALIVFMYFIF